MTSKLRIKYHTHHNQWFVQRKKWVVFWMDVSTGFESRQDARDYANGLVTLKRVVRLFTEKKL